VIGLDYSGKTTLLEKIKSKFGKLPSIPPEKIPPTIGMNLARIFYLGHQIVIWDLGGQIKMRNIWENYYQDANAIIFVVDSSDINRLEEAKLAYGMSTQFIVCRSCYFNFLLLEAVSDHDTVSTLPIFIFGNKQDLSVRLFSDLSLFPQLFHTFPFSPFLYLISNVFRDSFCSFCLFYREH
jgi:ADP-ribosylation factor related protein 1